MLEFNASACGGSPSIMFAAAAVVAAADIQGANMLPAALIFWPDAREAARHIKQHGE